jgi:DeoR/GlpR family transcriptional regulator of sugar metabolism
MEKTIIKVDYSVRKEIMKIFDVSYPTIRRALNGTTNTELAKKIRKVALIKGGVELKVVEKQNI